MTREQIEEWREWLVADVREENRDEANALCDLAERALLLEEVLAAAKEWNEARAVLIVAQSVHDGQHREIDDGYARVHASEVGLRTAIDRAEGKRT